MEAIGQELECGICLQTCRAAVETTCCFNLFCQRCIDGIKNCPVCRAAPCSNRPNHAVRRMISRIPVQCQACKNEVKRESMDRHKLECECLQHKCSKCEFVGPRKEFAKHLTDSHLPNLIGSYSEKLSEINLFGDNTIAPYSNM